MLGLPTPLISQAPKILAVTAVRMYGGIAARAVGSWLVSNRPRGIAMAMIRRNYVSPKILEKLVSETPFGMSELQALEKKFSRIGETDEQGNLQLNMDQFKQAMGSIGITNPIRCEQYFKMLDYNHDNKIDFRELMSGMSVLLRGSMEEWARFEFKVWDQDQNGYIDKDEFRSYIRATHEGSLSGAALQYLADETFDQLNANGDGNLDFEEFKQGILRSQMVLPRFHQNKKEKASGRLSMAERLVIDLLGERFKLKPGETGPRDPKNSNVYMLARGNGVVKHEDMVLTHITADKPAEAFWSMSAMFIESAPLMRMEAVDACEVLRLHRDELAVLAMNNHPGAVKLIERFGSLMHERANVLRDRILGKQKAGEEISSEQFAFLTRYQELVRIYALKYHAFGRHGKLEITPTRDLGSKNSLSIAYSPGVAEPCLAIHDNPDMSYEYTTRGHLVGVVSNGTAVLGLGDIGADASKPVMEGKAVLFKKFGGVDAFDVEINEKDPDKLIDIICSLEPTFGGINLEDIKAPECFYIEPKVQERMNIPIMHDDQHGTAIIAGAGLVNALEFANKDISNIKVVVNGCGAAGFTCARLFIALGVKPRNVICLDKDGVIYKGRRDLQEDPNLYLHEVAHDGPERTLADAMKGADVFAGLSVPNVLTPDMLLSMRKSPLIFALSNPIPEIDYQLAVRTRSDVIMGTGRSDLPNQINNVCAFPYIFRGALDCRAKKINEEMKMAATRAIAQLAKESPNFGPQNIIPSPLDPALLWTIPPAVAKAAQDTGVARLNLDVDEYRGKLMEEAASHK